MRGFVYFVRDDQGRIKIGYSANISARVRNLQTSHASRLDIVAWMHGSKQDEADLHIRWGRLRRTGEWFDPAPEIVSFMAESANAFDANDPRLKDSTRSDDQKNRGAFLERVLAFLRQRHGTNTGAAVAETIGSTRARVHKWFERASSPSGSAVIALIFAYGPEFLMAMCEGDAPRWLVVAVKESRRSSLEADIAEKKSELDRLLSSC